MARCVPILPASLLDNAAASTSAFAAGGNTIESPNALDQTNVVPTTAVAAATSMIGTTMPAHATLYFAVRVGKNVRSCIFLHWDDCRIHVEGRVNINHNCLHGIPLTEAHTILSQPCVEYQIFTTIEEAVEYISYTSMMMSVLATAAADRVHGNHNNNKNNNNITETNTVAAGSTTTTATPIGATPIGATRVSLGHLKRKSLLEYDEFTKVPEGNTCDMNNTTMLAHTSTAAAENSSNSTKKARTSSMMSNARNNNIKDPTSCAWMNPNTHSEVKNHTNAILCLPNKRWTEQYERLKALKTLNHGSFDLGNDKRLDRWITKQRYEYSLLKAGKSSLLGEVKLALLQEIEFPLETTPMATTTTYTNNSPHNNHNTTTSTTLTNNNNRNTSKAWEEKFKEFQECIKSHDGRWQIHVDDTKHLELKQWMEQQQESYEKLRRGMDLSISFPLTEERARRLVHAGMELKDTDDWNARIEQLKQYKAERNVVHFPDDHAVFGKWVISIRRQYRNIKLGKRVKDLTPMRLADLEALQFDFEGQGKRQQKYNDDFGIMYTKLVDYKKKYGDCCVRKHIDQSLYGWVVRQRNEYKKLQSKQEDCIMSAFHLQQLTQVGFPFSTRYNYRSWKEHYEELKAFKEEHGHLNISLNHPTLGEFICRHRSYYRHKMQGLKSFMTDKKIQLLEELGFQWNEEKWKDLSTLTKPKTWEERYQELLDFSHQHGHVIVPQHYPGLGQWVHTQRKDMRLLREGKHSAMTTEKAMLLTDVGFVMNVFEHKRRKKKDGSSAERI